MAVIGIIGGPGSGKTSAINALIKQGYSTKKEAATALIQEFDIDMDTKEGNDFLDENIIGYKIKQFSDALSMQLSSKMNAVFIDSSIFSTRVYMDKYGTKYESDMFTNLAKKYNYDYIFSFMHPGEMEDNGIRKDDSLEDALFFENEKKKTHEEFGYTVIDVPLFYEKDVSLSELENEKLIQQAILKRVEFMLGIIGKTIGEFVEENHDYISNEILKHEKNNGLLFGKNYPDGKKYEKLSGKTIDKIKVEIKTSQKELELLSIFEESKSLLSKSIHPEISKLPVFEYQLKSPKFFKGEYIGIFRIVHGCSRLRRAINKATS